MASACVAAGWLLLAAAVQSAPGAKGGPTGGWRYLFNGETLEGWKQSGFAGEAAITVEKSFQDGEPAIVAGQGAYLSGITWAKKAPLPRGNYEVALEAMKLEGDDFFCAVTFPVGESACTFVVGGWGGRVVGLSSIDDNDASENETSDAMDFVRNRWYQIRIRVTDAKIEAWIDDKQTVDLVTTGRKVALRYGDIDLSLPLGIAAYSTSAAWRNIRLREL